MDTEQTLFGREWYCVHCGAKGSIHTRTELRSVVNFLDSDRMLLYVTCPHCNGDVARNIDTQQMNRSQKIRLTQEAMQLLGLPPRVKIT